MASAPEPRWEGRRGVASSNVRWTNHQTRCGAELLLPGPDRNRVGSTPRDSVGGLGVSTHPHSPNLGAGTRGAADPVQAARPKPRTLPTYSVLSCPAKFSSRIRWIWTRAGVPLYSLQLTPPAASRQASPPSWPASHHREY